MSLKDYLSGAPTIISRLTARPSVQRASRTLFSASLSRVAMVDWVEEGRVTKRVRRPLGYYIPHGNADRRASLTQPGLSGYVTGTLTAVNRAQAASTAGITVDPRPQVLRVLRPCRDHEHRSA